MVRSIHCKCEYNFTCGYCLLNIKPWIWTPSSSRYSFAIDHKKAIERDNKDKQNSKEDSK